MYFSPILHFKKLNRLTALGKGKTYEAFVSHRISLKYTKVHLLDIRSYNNFNFYMNIRVEDFSHSDKLHSISLHHFRLIFFKYYEAMIWKQSFKFYLDEGKDPSNHEIWMTWVYAYWCMYQSNNWSKAGRELHKTVQLLLYKKG